MKRKLLEWAMFWGSILLLLMIPTLIIWNGCTKAINHAPALGIPREAVDLLPGLRSWWQCGKSDSPFVSRAFKDEVGRGVICCGFFKGCTIRR